MPGSNSAESSKDQRLFGLAKYEWQPVGGGEIHRFVVNGKTEESLGVQSYEMWGPRYWRVEVLNANDTAP